MFDVDKELEKIREQKEELDRKIKALEEMSKKRREAVDQLQMAQQKVREWEAVIADIDRQLSKRPRDDSVQDVQDNSVQDNPPLEPAPKRPRWDTAMDAMDFQVKADALEKKLHGEYTFSHHCRTPGSENFGYRMVFRKYRETAGIYPVAEDHFVACYNHLQRIATYEEALEIVKNKLTADPDGDIATSIRRDQELMNQAAAMRRQQFTAEHDGFALHF